MVFVLQSDYKFYLLGHEAELLGRQVVKLEHKPPVKVAISIQRPVVDICLLFVHLHAGHPAVKGKHRFEHQSSRSGCNLLLPLHFGKPKISQCKSVKLLILMISQPYPFT